MKVPSNTAPSDEALKFDITAMRELGFNLIRKHIKVEDPRQLYWADKYGMFFWEDMPWGPGFNTEDGREAYEYPLEKMIERDFNHPCIIAIILLLIINPSVFERICKSNIYAENFSYKITTERFSDVMWALQQILFMSFDKRLAIFLLDEISINNSDTIHLTHEQIAKYVGSAREVVSRMLKHFENEGLVELSRGEIKVVNKKKMRSLI